LFNSVSVENVHNIGETRNAKYLVNVVGGIRDEKTLLAQCPETDKAEPQKRRGNKNNPGKIKIKPNILMTLLEIGHSMQQIMLDFRTQASIEPT